MKTNSNKKSILIEEVKEAVRYLNLVKQGKMKTQSLKEVLSEL
jgi:hypothetical protein